MGYDNHNKGSANWELIHPPKWKFFAKQKYGSYLPS